MPNGQRAGSRDIEARIALPAFAPRASDRQETTRRSATRRVPAAARPEEKLHRVQRAFSEPAPLCRSAPATAIQTLGALPRGLNLQHPPAAAMGLLERSTHPRALRPRCDWEVPAQLQAAAFRTQLFLARSKA